MQGGNQWLLHSGVGDIGSNPRVADTDGEKLQ